MKLNTKRTVLVGMAFLSICTFWQMYEAVIPLILKHTFHVSDTASGAVMALLCSCFLCLAACLTKPVPDLESVLHLLWLEQLHPACLCC